MDLNKTARDLTSIEGTMPLFKITEVVRDLKNFSHLKNIVTV